MTDHPSTFNATRTNSAGIDWDDRASVHRKDDGQGVLDGAKAVHRGTLAKMVAIVMSLPEGDRGEYVIQKAGDHRLDLPEIEALAAEPDFPGRGG